MTRIWLTSLLILGILYGPSAYAEQKLELKYPPESLAQWYKPKNKRQVWLHTMFKLRRSMQAIRDYASIVNPGEQDYALMKKWAQRFQEQYMSIAEMVPEWQSLIQPQQLDGLLKNIEQKKPQQVLQTLKQLKRNCLSCHNKYQAVAAAVYRSPDYSAIKIALPGQETVLFYDVMYALPEPINRILIAMEDQQPSRALDASRDLNNMLSLLAYSCTDCHKDKPPVERILGKQTDQRLQAVNHAIENNDRKTVGKLMGELGVTVCARCHGVHRTLGDLRDTLIEDWRLIK